MPNKMKRALGLIVICFLCLSVWEFFSWRSNRARLAISEMSTLFNTLELGMTKQDFNRKHAEGSFQTLKVRSVTEDNLLVLTPLQWGAANWVMWVGFSNNTISSVKIRLQDSQDVKPKGVPNDKLASH